MGAGRTKEAGASISSTGAEWGFEGLDSPLGLVLMSATVSPPPWGSPGCRCSPTLLRCFS